MLFCDCLNKHNINSLGKNKNYDLERTICVLASSEEIAVEVRAKKIIPLKTKRRPLYLNSQSVPRCKHFLSRL